MAKAHVWLAALCGCFTSLQLVAGTTPPSVGLWRPDNLPTFGPDDIVFVLFTPSRPVEVELAASGANSSLWSYPFMAFSGFNFHIIYADTCPGDSVDCTDFYAMERVMAHFLSSSLTHPYPTAAIGGAHKGLSIAHLLSALRIPTIGHWMGEDSLDDKDEYPYFARANSPDARKFQAMVELMLGLGYTRGVLWHGNSTFHTEMRTVVLQAAREAVSNTTITINTITIYDRSTQYWPPTLDEEDDRYDEWESALRSARDYNAHFFMYGFTDTMPYMEFLSYMHLNGLIGGGYLWVSEFALHNEYAAFQAAVAPTSPYANILPIDGMITLVEINTGVRTSKLTDYVKSLQNRTDALESWILDEVDASIWDNPLAFPTDAHILFDAAWTVLKATNKVLLEQGRNMTSDSLLSRISSTTFEGASGYISFDDSYSRIVTGAIVQYQQSCNFLHTNHSNEGESSGYVTIGEWSSAPKYGAEVVFFQELMVYYNCSRDQPPDRDLVCGEGSYYNRTHGRCYQCDPGTYAGATNMHQCTLCQAGTFASEIGLSQCTACGQGTYARSSGSVGCDDCPLGKFQEDVQQSECRSCFRGQFAGALGQTGCDMCPVGSYAGEEGTTACTRCDGGRETRNSGSEEAKECVCPGGMVSPDNTSISSCVHCSDGLDCQFGASLANWSDYPTLLPGFWAIGSDPLDVYICQSETRCPGGEHGQCGEGLTGGRACAHCPDGHHWNGNECRECKVRDGTRALFPWVPIIGTPIGILVLYSAGGGTYADWRSWTRSIVAFAFILLNHVQVATLLTQANIALPRYTKETGEVWAWTIDWVSIFKLECAGYKRVEYSMSFQSVAPMFLVAWCIALYGISRFVSSAFGRTELIMRPAQLFDVLMSIIFSFFNAIAAMSLALYKCQENPNGTYSLKADFSVVCYDDAIWKNMLGLAMAAVLLYCVGCGVLFLWATIRAVDRFADEEFRTAWKFLFIRYRMDTWWWSLAFLAKGVILNLCLVVTWDGLYQLYLMMGFGAIYTLAVVACMPYRVWYANHLEVLSGFSIILIASIMTNFAPKSESHRDNLDSSSVYIAWLPIPVALALAAIVVHRQFVGQKSSNEELSPARQALVKRLREACNIIAVLTDEDIADFLTYIDEPDRHAVRKALVIIESEVLGIKHWRLNARKVCIKKISESRRTSAEFQAAEKVSSI